MLENFKEMDLLQIIDMNICQIKNVQQFRQNDKDKVNELVQNLESISSLKTNDFFSYWNSNNEKFDWENIQFEALKERKMNRVYVAQNSL